jgi:RsiW-degrading membrane proteinase PrsW (M82 family)
MWQQMIDFLESWFVYSPDPGLKWLLIAVGLAMVFGGVWLLAHWPPLFKRPWLWAVAVVSAFLTLLAVVFVQIPLQTWTGQALVNFWSSQTLYDWLLLAAIPQVLLSGLVQEGAKMVPMVAWWWRSGRRLDPKLGLAVGAIAGAGFGIFEAFWVHGSLFASGWTWQAVESGGYQALLPFSERFFAVGIHIAMSALAGYGLGRGRGWQFYLIAAGLHTALNYSIVFVQKGIWTANQLEVYVAVLAVLVTVVVMWLRWWKTEKGPEGPVVPAGTVSDGYLSGPERQAEDRPGSAGDPDTRVDAPADHPDDPLR